MNQRAKQIVALLIAALLLAASGITVGPIGRERKDIEQAADPNHKAGEAGSLKVAGDGDDKVLEDERLPPHITVLIAALGTFRGLIVDFLWYRANELKEDGQFYAANTYSQWITTLQPRFPVVWEFHAWNMAYNISVVTKTPQERWDWVHKGIKLLRDRGIRYNPRAVRLYKELSWIYFHKINDMSDDAHWYYKSRIAEEWGEVLGVPTAGLTTEQAIAEFRKIVDAPAGIDQVLVAHPEAQKLLDALRALGFEIDTPEHRLQTLRIFGQLAVYNYMPQPIFVGFKPQLIPRALRENRQNPAAQQNTDAFIALLQDKNMEPAVHALLEHLRHRVLVEEYRMKPQAMVECMELYGPLDWRHPCSHSLYWAREGTNMAERLIGREEQENIDFLNSFRQKIFSLQSLMRGGVVTFDPITQYISHEPDPRFIDSYGKERGYALDKIPTDDKKMSVESSFAAGHENFLQQAAYFSYIYGNPEQSVKYWTAARDLYGTNEHNIRSATYTKGYEEWLMDYLKENIDTMMNARQFVDAAIQRAIKEGLANGRADRWEYFLSLGQKAHNKYNRDTTVTHLTEQNRRDLPPFNQMLDEVYVNFMQMPYNHVLARSHIWRNTPEQIRKNTFQRLQPILYSHSSASGIPPESLFPAPEGYIIRTEKDEKNPDQVIPEGAAPMETK